MEAGENYSQRPWLKSYTLGPYKLDHSIAPFPQKPVFEILDQAAKKFPNQTAILFQDKTLKYHQLKSRVDSLANAFLHLGLEKGDRVSIYLPNCPEHILAYWAILKAGGAAVPISILHISEALFYEVDSSGSRFIVCHQAYLDRVLPLLERNAVEGILVTSDGGFEGKPVPTLPPKHVHDFAALIANHDPNPPQVEIDPTHDLCELAFTGGATGVAKGVMLSHANRYASIVQSMPWYMKPLLGGIMGKTSVLLSTPLFHSYGNIIQISTINLGNRVLLLPDGRDTAAMIASIYEHRPFIIPGVPTQFMRMADAGLKRSNSMLMSAGAPLPEEVAHEIEHKTGMPITEAYGLTETSSISHMNLSAFSRITGFMSKAKPGIGVPLPDVDCRLVDPENGADVPVGSPGEIMIRGPQVMLGYWPEVGSGLTDDGWLRTGDIAIMDEAGYFQIVDRIKDMVNVSGMKVYTTQVDEVLFKHPAVQVAAAFGIPDVDIPGSERVMAVVSLKDGYQGAVSEQELRDFCRQQLAPYAVPKIIEFRDELPLTVSEKVFKKALRDQAIARMKAQKED